MTTRLPRSSRFPSTTAKLITLVVTAIIGCHWPAASASDQPPAEAPRPANWRSLRLPVAAARPLPPVNKLIALLESPRYLEREVATRLLSRHGKEAVPLLQKAAQSDNPEVAIRATNALEGLWMRAVARNDFAASEAAIFALDELAATQKPRLINRVSAIFAAHAKLVYEYSMNEVLRHGGDVEMRQGIHDTLPDGTLRPAIKHVIVGRNWTGGVAALRHVRRLSPPAVYFIRGADLPEDIAKQFDKVKPHIEAVARGASQLGVTGKPNGFGGNPGCRIIKVAPESSAANAGMHPGDVIKLFNKVKIIGFAHLVKEIAKIEPGTTVPATVNRRGEEVKLEVTLQPWSELSRNEATK